MTESISSLVVKLSYIIIKPEGLDHGFTSEL